MTPILSPQRSNVPESDSPELTSTVKQQVSDILEEAQPQRQTRAPSRKTAPAQWGYSVPFAGVRYYSF